MLITLLKYTLEFKTGMLLKTKKVLNSKQQSSDNDTANDQFKFTYHENQISS